MCGRVDGGAQVLLRLVEPARGGQQDAEIAVGGVGELHVACTAAERQRPAQLRVRSLQFSLLEQKKTEVAAPVAEPAPVARRLRRGQRLLVQPAPGVQLTERVVQPAEIAEEAAFALAVAQFACQCKPLLVEPAGVVQARLVVHEATECAQHVGLQPRHLQRNALCQRIVEHGARLIEIAGAHDQIAE